ncbi:MAG: tonB dependent receptor family protein [Rhodospirillales bacterium]|nr:tonB dependent receptor family protein [Rhodospirillales bacterium]
MVAKRLSLLASLLCAAAYILPHDAAAQAPAVPADQDVAPSAGLEEIVVTAQKRSETLRKVPESISVMTGVQLEAQHIDDYADLARTIPDLSFSSLGAPGLSNLEIRGISSTVGTSTVAIYLDDAPITIRNNGFYSGQAEPLLFDLAQSEVLRGPQGTLYGASSMGGTIKFVSHAVNLNDFEGSASGQLSGTEHGGLNYVAKGVLNVPIVPGTMGLRIGFQTTQDSGFVDHARLDGSIDRTGINGDRANVIKASLLWDVSDRLTITPSVFIQRTIINDTGLVDFATPNYTTTKLVQEGGSDTLAVPSIKVSYDLDFADLTSVTSYAFRHFPRTTDGTYFNSVFVGGFIDGLGVVGTNGQAGGANLAALPGPVYNSLNTRQLTEEIRLVSKPYDPESGNPLTWIVGLYYSDAKNTGTSAQYIPGFNSTFQRVYGVPAADVIGVPIPNDLFYDFATKLDDREYAAFGELSYNLSPELKFTAGLRYLYGRSALNGVQGGFFASNPAQNGVTKAYAPTPKFSVTYDVDENATLYATVGKGFRLGGINGPVPVLQCGPDLAAFGLASAPVGYQPDKLWNYEVGGKARLMNNQVSVNASAYDIEWDKIQLDVPLKTCGFDFTGNLGQARSYGVETEVLWRVDPALTLGMSGQYNHDTFTTSVPGLGVNKGDPVPGSPKWSLNLTAEYAHPINDDVQAFIRANWQFIGNSHGTIIRDNQDYDRPSYNLAGGSIGVDFDNWEISLFAKNLFDTKKIIQSPADNFVAEGYTPTPRIVGAQADVHF